MEKSSYQKNIEIEKAPPIKCPSHREFYITNLCMVCLEPLCPECLNKHTKLHFHNNTDPNINTIDRVKKICSINIQNLQQQFYKGKENLIKISKANKIELKNISFQKLENAKSKIEMIVNNYFQTLKEELIKVFIYFFIKIN